MATEINKGMVVFQPKSRKDWRKWLIKNSQTEKEICLVISHKRITTGIHYAEAVEEALCFGWVDSLTNNRDEGSFYQRFSPRKPKSNWSEINIERVERMIREGLMMEQGQKMIDIAKQNDTFKPRTVVKIQV